MDSVISLIAAFLGAFGFSLLYGLRGKLLIPASLGGLLTWGSYLLFKMLFQNTGAILSCFLATVVATVYVYVMAYTLKKPTVLFLIPAVIPLIPGSDLYYMFLFLYRNDRVNARIHSANLLIFAFSIAAGMAIGSVLKAVIKQYLNKNGGISIR